jgi:hypothetical protein
MSGITVGYTIEDRELEPIGGMAVVVALVEQTLAQSPTCRINRDKDEQDASLGFEPRGCPLVAIRAR